MSGKRPFANTPAFYTALGLFYAAWSRTELAIDCAMWRGRKRERRTDLAVKQAFYRLADEKREIILVACSKCDWRAAFSRDCGRSALDYLIMERE
jgi:hypothetical protein